MTGHVTTERTTRTPPVPRLRSVAAARFRASTEATTAFFDHRAGDLARACLDLARAFHRGHRLLVVGTGAAASDALHVAVEFVHPVVVGKRALPAIALTQEPADWIEATAEPGDMVLGLASADRPAEREAVRRALEIGRARGCGTIALVGRPEPAAGAAAAVEWTADHVVVVESDDAFVVQEVAETAYHVLWELVHVFLDHPEVLP